MARPSYGDPLSRERPSTVDTPPPPASSCAGAAGNVCFTGAAAPSGSPATGIDIPGREPRARRTDPCRAGAAPRMTLASEELAQQPAVSSRQVHGREGRWGRPEVNMGAIERVVRLLIGLLVAGSAALLLLGRLHGAPGAAVWTLLGVVVADLVISGLMGCCPLYRYVPAPWARRGPR